MYLSTMPCAAVFFRSAPEKYRGWDPTISPSCNAADCAAMLKLLSLPRPIQIFKAIPIQSCACTEPFRRSAAVLSRLDCETNATLSFHAQRIFTTHLLQHISHKMFHNKLCYNTFGTTHVLQHIWHKVFHNKLCYSTFDTTHVLQQTSRTLCRNKLCTAHFALQVCYSTPDTRYVTTSSATTHLAQQTWHRPGHNKFRATTHLAQQICYNTFGTRYVTTHFATTHLAQRAIHKYRGANPCPRGVGTQWSSMTSPSGSLWHHVGGERGQRGTPEEEPEPPVRGPPPHQSLPTLLPRKREGPRR